ncbi:MAG: TIGR00725 family protein [Thermoplasmata archaeon]
MIIGVIGGASCSDEIYKIAEEVGKKIAENGATLICGGLTGVMEAVCKGAKSAGGITIGILPGTSKKDANRYVDIPIATGISFARNTIIVRTADVCIAVDGRYGTLSEIAFGLNVGTPIIALKTWDIPSAGTVDKNLFIVAKTPEEAVKLALKCGARKLHAPKGACVIRI